STYRAKARHSVQHVHVSRTFLLPRPESHDHKFTRRNVITGHPGTLAPARSHSPRRNSNRRARPSVERDSPRAGAADGEEGRHQSVARRTRFALVATPLFSIRVPRFS